MDTRKTSEFLTFLKVAPANGTHFVIYISNPFFSAVLKVGKILPTVSDSNLVVPLLALATLARRQGHTKQVVSQQVHLIIFSVVLSRKLVLRLLVGTLSGGVLAITSETKRVPVQVEVVGAVREDVTLPSTPRTSPYILSAHMFIVFAVFLPVPNSPATRATINFEIRRCFILKLKKPLKNR